MTVNDPRSHLAVFSKPCDLHLHPDSRLRTGGLLLPKQARSPRACAASPLEPTVAYLFSRIPRVNREPIQWLRPDPASQTLPMMTCWLGPNWRWRQAGGRSSMVEPQPSKLV